MSIFDDSVFTLPPDLPQLDASIAEHSRWVCQRIYSKPYPNGKARDEHGGPHVSSAAIFGLMWANLRRRHGDPEALALTPRDMKLIQIALLFHDSGREGDGEDHWDNDSALNLYKYLTLSLGVSPEKAAALAEATANKDFDPENPEKPYQKLIITEGQAKFIDSLDKPPRSIFQKIIHDGDCLEVLRAREIFDARYLDFFADFCKTDSLAKRELLQIIAEARALLLQQGRLMRKKDPKIKKRYADNLEVYRQHHKDLQQHFALRQLTAKDQLGDPKYLQNLVLQLIPGNKVVGERLTLENIVGLSSDDAPPYLLFRGLGAPSAKPPKDKYDTLARLEIRKILREVGNSARSTTLLPCETYTRAGLLIVIDEDDYQEIQEISEKDSGSGVGKKHHKLTQSMPVDEVREKLRKLSEKARLGVSDAEPTEKSSKLFHSEILLILRNKIVKGISYSRDFSTYCEFVLKDDPLPGHPDVGFLETYFIQQVYFQESGITLPIFETSYHSNKLHEISVPTKRVLPAWRHVCKAYIEKQLESGQYQRLLAMSSETLKTNAVFGSANNSRALRNQSVDMLCDPALRAEIDNQIAVIKAKAIEVYEQKFLHVINYYDPQARSIIGYLNDASLDLQLTTPKLILSLLNLTIHDPEQQQRRDTLLQHYRDVLSVVPIPWIHSYMKERRFKKDYWQSSCSQYRAFAAESIIIIVRLFAAVPQYLTELMNSLEKIYLTLLREGDANPNGICEVLEALCEIDADLPRAYFSTLRKNIMGKMPASLKKVLRSEDTTFAELQLLQECNEKYFKDSTIRKAIISNASKRIQRMKQSASRLDIDVLVSNAKKLNQQNMPVDIDDLLDNSSNYEISSLLKLAESAKSIELIRPVLPQIFAKYLCIQEVTVLLKLFGPRLTDRDFNQLLISAFDKAPFVMGEGFDGIDQDLLTVRACLPNDTFTSSQEEIISYRLQLLCREHSPTRYPQFSSMANAFKLVNATQRMSPFFCHSYFFSFLGNFNVNLWNLSHPKIASSLVNFTEIGINIADLKSQVEQECSGKNIPDYRRIITALESLSDSDKQLLIKNIEQNLQVSLRYDQPCSLKSFDAMIQTIMSERKLDLADSSALKKLSNDISKFCRHLDDSIWTLQQHNKERIAHWYIKSLVSSYYLAHSQNAPQVVAQTEPADFPPAIPGSRQLETQVQRNLDQLTVAALKVQSIFRSQQAKQETERRKHLKEQIDEFEVMAVEDRTADKRRVIS